MSATHCIKMEDGSTKSISEMLNCIERYNPDHLKTLEKYVEEQAEKNTYDLETNLAVLKLYQFNPGMLNMDITYIILLKALTNLPHTDFVLAKCLLLPSIMADPTIVEIINLADTLETCKFSLFWEKVREKSNKIKFNHITGFYDSIRKFVCHVVGITFQNIRKESLAKLMGDIDDNALNQWIKKNGWKQKGGLVFIASQDENIKTKNITEKIEFDNLASIMAKCL